MRLCIFKCSSSSHPSHLQLFYSHQEAQNKSTKKAMSQTYMCQKDSQRRQFADTSSYKELM